MKSIRWSAAVLTLLTLGPASWGQYILAPAGGLSVGYTRVTRNSALSINFRKPLGYYYGAPGFGPFGPVVPVAPPFASQRFTQVVVVTPPPLVPPLPAFLLPPEPLEPPLPPPQPRLRVDPLEDEGDPPLPGRDAGVFRPLDPDNRDRARRPVMPPAPPKKEEEPGKKEEPKKEAPPPPPPDRLLPPPPMRADPAEEALRQIDLGREAFARGEYGRAAERFRQAADLAPGNALAHLLLGQSQIALGNHRRAFDAILVGLRLEPDWPRQPFRPIELYGENVLEYAEQQRLLEDLHEVMPEDPVLQFLLGYQLWFDGRRDEAKALLLRSSPGLPDPGIVERFLRALPAGEGI